MSDKQPSNALELVRRLHQKCGVQGEGPQSYENQTGVYLDLVEWIQEAYDDIQGLWLDWKWMWMDASFSTVALQSVYPKPPTVGEWYRDAFWFDGAELDEIEWEAYQRDRDTYAQMVPARPQEFTIRPDDAILLLPAPDDIYTINAEAKQPIHELNLSTDEPLIPLQYRMAIVYRAMIFYALYENAEEVLEDATSHYANKLKQLEAYTLPRNTHRNKSEGNKIVVRAS